jgi:predicted TIM-barrel fold metal-dependent hydrolase
VTYNVNRLRRVGYLPRFDGYLRQLGFSVDERAAVTSATEHELAALVEHVANREPWGLSPDSHLLLTQCRLATGAMDSAESTIGLAPLDALRLLDFYASLQLDMRMFVGVDPGRPATLDLALGLRDHPAFAGLALIPYLAEAPLDAGAFEPALEAAARHDLAIWAHCSTHYRRDVPYDIGHPRHADAVLRRYPELRLLVGHAGWPFVAEYCTVAARFPNVALELSTFPPRLLTDPGWSLTPLLSRRGELPGRIFFGSGAVSAPKAFMDRLRQLDELPLGDYHASWRGAGFVSWLQAD